jgi:hypothetical protein
MFRVNNHGYSMTFENGFTVSVRWHKCTHYVTGRTLYSDDPDMNWRTMATDSVNAEVAVIHEASGAFMETPFNNSDTVIGYQSPDQVHEIMAWAKELEVRGRWAGMTEFDKGIIRDYRSIMDHITRTVASVNGVVTKAENDQRDKLEAQLMNRGLSHVMTDEDVEDYYDAHRPVYL